MYNLTNITASRSILGLMQGVNNTLMLGMLFTLLLMGICVVAFISFYYSTQDVGKSIIGASFLGFVLSLTLGAMGLVDDLVIFISLILLAGSIAFLWKNQ